MKKLLILLLCTSCVIIDEYPPNLYIFHAKPNVNYINISLDELIYDFDETIQYNTLNTLYADIYRNDIYYTTKLCDTSYISVSNEDQIEVIISNIRLNGGKYLRIKDQETKGFSFLEDYPYHFTINDAFIGKQSFPINVHDYEWEPYPNHCYTQIPVDVNPITYHYIIQLISNDPSIICDSLIISGLAYKYDIRNKTVMSDLCNSKLILYDKQIKNNYGIYASRFNTFGIPSDNSSWNTIESNKVYVTFKVMSSSKYVKIDISQKMYSIPKGGIITIFIDNSKIDASSDFIIEIDDWDTHIIDIDF